ncbi:MAG: DUF1593 domain-containing protein [Opitutaceae bacterium]|nr:DUF1593 domain-containing protein [Opitutaceae bacterium]
MRQIIYLAFLFLAPLATAASLDERPRVIVLTDFFKDPDDKQSMIRFLTCANEFEVEGLLATSLAYGDGSVRPELIVQLIDAYGAVLENLRRHERPGYVYPPAESLKQRVKAGAPIIRTLVGTKKGFPVPYPPGARDSRSCDPAEQWIGNGRDTAASEHIIRVVDRDDPRPVWVVVWGGAIDLAQALWKIRGERPAEAAARFVGKLRVYQVSWQDTGAVWIWNEFPDLFRIQCSNAMRGMYAEGRPAMRNEAWVNENVRRGHGALGAEYPKAGNTDGIKEGDTPSFLHLLAAGLGEPEQPDWGGWGGRFRRLHPEQRYYVDARDRHPNATEEVRENQWTVGRWHEATSNDLAARMDWCVRGYGEANHHPVVRVDGDAGRRVLHRTVVAGQRVELDAAGTQDPDGHAIDYRWWQYVEAGTYGEAVRIQNADSPRAGLVAPVVDGRKTVHVILAATDRGQPPLTSYRRVIISVDP